MALPLMPEFMAPQDGAEKPDCERNAAHSKMALDVSSVLLSLTMLAGFPRQLMIVSSSRATRRTPPGSGTGARR